MAAAAGGGGGLPQTLEMLDDLQNIARQLAARGAYAECIRLHEQAIALHVRVHGPASPEVQRCKLDVAELYNQMALQQLYAPSGGAGGGAREGEEKALAAAKRYLKMAEILTEPEPIAASATSSADLVAAVGGDEGEGEGEGSMSPTRAEIHRRRLGLRSSTYNNFTCLSKKEGHLRAALQFARKALRIQSRHSMLEDKAASLLNIAALLSRLGKHDQALRAAEDALDTVLLLEDLRHEQEAGTATLTVETTDDSGGGQPARDRLYYAPLQVMCFTNMAAELEHLRRWPQCLDAYETAYQLAFLAFGPQHPLVQRSRSAFVEVYARVEDRLDDGRRRREAQLGTKVSLGPNETVHDLSLYQQRRKKAVLRAQKEAAAATNTTTTTSGSSRPSALRRLATHSSGTSVEVSRISRRSAAGQRHRSARSPAPHHVAGDTTGGGRHGEGPRVAWDATPANMGFQAAVMEPSPSPSY